MADWLVAVARPHSLVPSVGRPHLTKIFDDLTGRGHTCYQPRERVRVVRRGRKSWQSRLLLGHYVLVELLIDWAHQFVDIMRSQFVSRILTADERPLLARECEVQRVRASEDQRGFVPTPKKLPKTGDRGFLTEGAFASFEAEFHSRDEVELVDRVLVSLFGRLQPISVDTGTWVPA